MFNHNFLTPPKLIKVDENGTRRYQIPSGHSYESVTNYIGRLFPKPDLHKWRKRVGEKKATQISTAAATRGTALHKAAESYLLNETPDLENSPTTKDLFIKIRPIIDRLNNIRLIETPLYSDELELAGTPDVIADYSGELSVVDFKSSTRMKKKFDIMNYWLQCGAYGIMYNEHFGEFPVKSVIIFGVPTLPFGICQIVPMEDCVRWFQEFRKDPQSFYDRLEVVRDTLKRRPPINDPNALYEA